MDSAAPMRLAFSVLRADAASAAAGSLGTMGNPPVEVFGSRELLGVNPPYITLQELGEGPQAVVTTDGSRTLRYRLQVDVFADKYKTGSAMRDRVKQLLRGQSAPIEGGDTQWGFQIESAVPVPMTGFADEEITRIAITFRQDEITQETING